VRKNMANVVKLSEEIVSEAKIVSLAKKILT
jgi:hypothetical protein